ncbi:TPA: baseplate J/gp47 family protein [Serratia rubidaea]|nr:baseplate J/gp47 family protein [Serratia rubidaea]HDJ1447180.1 baseplate J/gp47 family protein [Serratia rubidaea]HDJ1463984.1 baseplate J/gp47 family protein [Serratia rubidaea]HDJ2773035.1 baseplate J/gp47 family protein [Serratia rubidaea]
MSDEKPTLSTAVPAITFSTTGLLVPDESDILNGRLSDFSSALGGAMSTSLTSPQGQLAMSDSAIIADKNDQLLAIVNQINPDFSSGRFQDAIGRIYFIDRIGATGTTVTARCSGLVGTQIPAGSMAQDEAGYLYISQADVTIGSAGNVDVIFQNLTTGPIGCPIGALSKVYKAIPGWSGVKNDTAGVLGNDEETRANFEHRRRNSVANNARNTLNAIKGQVLGVDAVVDAYVTHNPTPTERVEGVTKFPLKRNSFYVGVYGGKAEEIADAIWRKAPPGVDMNGDTSQVITDKDGYDPPYPEYTITWQTVTPISAHIKVELKKSEYLPADITELVQEAVQGAFNGVDGGTRARIASTLSAGRYYAGVYAIDPINVDILGITLSRDGSTYATSISFGIDEIPTLDDSNISVVLT